ncbi:hypothetical protein [Olleya sp. YS]|uniref:hypothetical protein n=1 Tax=Olleya sp. YS TaxID=3028318 RepID=UPI0024345D23|nr:hypothetical protein [Olleya sp. YS]WGD35948.1 hypothetical protein Ollyesu_05920 [Olleya sp. YS]
MYKKPISIFFTILFLGIITAPSIIIAMDDSVDISVFYSLSEEEEEIKNIKLISSFEDLECDFSEFSNYDLYLGYYYKTYPKPHLNIISPPPEHYL